MATGAIPSFVLHRSGWTTSLPFTQPVQRVHAHSLPALRVYPYCLTRNDRDEAVPLHRAVQLVRIHEHAPIMGQAFVDTRLPFHRTHAFSREIHFRCEVIHQDASSHTQHARGFRECTIPLRTAPCAVIDTECDDEVDRKSVV